MSGIQRASLRHLGDGSQILTEVSEEGKSLKCLQGFLLVTLGDEGTCGNGVNVFSFVHFRV